MYVLGTAASVAAVMIVAVFLHVRLSSVYPELHRGDIYRVTFAEKLNPDGEQDRSGGLTYAMARRLAEAASDYADVSLTMSYGWSHVVTSSSDLEDNEIEVDCKATDDNFFKVYAYRFEQGKPFDAADVAGGNRKAVITSALARQLFDDASDAVGRQLRYNNVEYTVCGVVKAGSGLLQGSYADIFVPHRSVAIAGDDDDPFTEGCCVGDFYVYARVHVPDGGKRLNADLAEIIRRHDSEHRDDHRLHITHMAESAFTTLSKRSAFEEGGGSDFVRKFGLIFLILLLVPALNLGGLISGSMDSRLSEMGVRKAFGAGSGRLLWQLIAENLFLSTVGGAIGLVLSWWAISGWRQWLFASLGGSTPGRGFSDYTINNDMLFSPVVFVIAFATCLILNTASSLIPAVKALRKPIVSSLNQM